MTANGAPSLSGEPGLHRQTMDFESLIKDKRVYRYFVPGGYYAAQKHPLVIALHGGISRGRNIRLRSGLDNIAERENFIAVYPEGNGIGGMLQHWNAGTCCAKAMERGIDDAGFVIRVVDELAKSLSIDLNRVYVFGFSNGAMLAYQLAANHPERFAAIAAVSGTFGRVASDGSYDWFLPKPKAPVPTLIIHGDQDNRLPFDGLNSNDSERKGQGMIPTLESAGFWARVNGCSSESAQVESGYANVDLFQWPGCKSENRVQVYRLKGWGHKWAGASRKTRADHSTVGGFETAEVIWRFFENNSR